MADLLAFAFCILLCLGVFVAVLWGIGRLVGGLLSWLWSSLYGPERTATARRWIVGLPYTLLIVLFVSRLELPMRPDLFVALRWVLVACLSIATSAQAVGIWQALPPIVARSGVQPESLERDHDGIGVTITRRRTWPAVLLFGLGPLVLPLALVVAMIWRLVPIPRTPVRVRSEVVEVGTGAARATIPLAGLRIRQQVRWDGTPLVALHGADGQACVLVVGGHPPYEVEWLVQTLERAARRAPQVQPVAAPPPALRAMVARSRTPNEPTRS